MADYIQVSGTTRTIKSYTGGSRYVVTNGGVLAISSGGVLESSNQTQDHLIMYDGAVIIYSGGTAIGGEFWDRGLCVVYAGGDANALGIYSSAWLDVSSGGKVYTAGIHSGGIMDVKSGGFAYETFVQGGEMRVDHYASKTEVYSGGIVRVGSGATLIDTKVNSSCTIIVSSGGTAQSTYLSAAHSATIYGKAYYNRISSASMRIMSGGYANTNDVKNGVLNVSSGGTVTSNLISSGGSMNIDKGGFVSKTTIFTSGSAYIGGTASGTVMSGGSLDMFGSSYNGVYSSGVVSIGYGGYSYNEVFSNARTYITSSGSASGVVYGGTVGSGCSVIVRGGRFGGTTVSNAVFDLKGGNADVSGVKGASAWISGGVFYASGGGVMSSATVEPSSGTMGKMYVFSGTTATKVDISPNGHLGIMVGAFVTSAVVKPNSGGSSATIGVSSGGSLGSAFVYGGRLDVGSGGAVRAAYLSMGGLGVVNGTIFSANVDSGSPLQVSSGGLVSSAVISSGGRINLNQGKLFSAYVAKGGILSVNSGGSVGSGNVFGSAVVSYGSATGLSVQSGGRLTVSAYGVTSLCAVNGGTADVYSGGSFLKTTISQGGSVALNPGAIALSCTVGSGGVMKVSSGALLNFFDVKSGGKVTGYYDCYGITFSSGGIADINIFNTSAGNTKVVLQNLYYAKNKGVNFTLTVSASQTKGTYKLADNAPGFNESITVQNIYGDAFGTLTLGQVSNINGVGYKLELDSSDVLTVTVGAAIPVPTMKAYFTGDFNGGGKDMIAKQKENSVSVYCNGDQWGLGIALDTGWDVVATGDFNGDKKDDFLRVNTEGYVVGEMSIGNGMFTPQVLNLKNAGWNILGTGDFNHNGTDDVLIANPTGASSTVGLLGYWESGVTWTLINGYSPEWECVSTGDFNNDGKCDMLWRNSFVGDGGLTYNAYCTWIVDPPAGQSDWRMVSVANPKEWNFLCSGDFDGNGSHDIAMINGEGVVGIWGVADGYLNSWSILSAVDASAWELAGVGDFNGDKTDDIAWRNMSTGLTGYWQINNKTLTTWANIATIA